MLDLMLWRAALLMLGVALALGTTASAANPGREKIEFNTADQAAARAVGVSRADLRPLGGWTGGQVKPDLSASPTCPSYHPRLSDFVLTGAASTDWNRATAEVNAQTEILRTARMVRREWQLQVKNPAALPCVRRFTAKSLAAQGATLLSLTRIPFPRIATYTAAYLLVARVGSVKVASELLQFGRGRTEITLTVTDLFAARRAVSAQTLGLARILADRIQA